MIAEKTFLFEEINDYLHKDFSLFLFGDGKDDRHDFYRSYFLKTEPQKSLILHYENDIESFSYNESEMMLLKKHFLSTIKNILNNNSSSDAKMRKVFIDITGIPTPLIFYSLLCFRELKCQVFCGYTKPIDYQRKPLSEGISEERFFLSDKFSGIKPLPGFLRSNRLEKEKVLVLFLGYEGSRSLNTYNTVEPSHEGIIPVIGLPGYRAGWHNYTFECNLPLIIETNSIDYVRYITADSPFEAYSLLCLLKKENIDKHLMIAPIGTKAHALGTALYAIKNSDCSIIFDHPVKTKNRSRSILESIVYDISELLGE